MAVIYTPDGAKLSYDAEEIDARLGPEDNGTEGQVLVSNGDGTREWRDPTGGGLSSNMTYYVSNSGSDITGDGTQGNPFATFNHALSIIPKNLNGYAATVTTNDSEFTTSEKIDVKGFFSGIIKIEANKIISSASQGIEFTSCVNAVISISEINDTYVPASGVYYPIIVSAIGSTVEQEKDLAITRNSGLIRSGRGINLNKSNYSDGNYNLSISGQLNNGIACGPTSVYSSSYVTVSIGVNGVGLVSNGGILLAKTNNTSTTKRSVNNGLICENGTIYTS